MGIADQLKESKGLDAENLVESTREVLRRAFPSTAPSLPAPPEGKPLVILVVGVNGTGKTTSAAKLAHLLQKQGSRVLLAAADTFRAAAVEQLQSWADKLNIPICKGAPSQDPASVCYEAHTQAIREGFQYLICDTAGRLHTRHNLMEELSKIRRTLAKQDTSAPTAPCWWWMPPQALTPWHKPGNFIKRRPWIPSLSPKWTVPEREAWP